MRGCLRRASFPHTIEPRSSLSRQTGLAARASGQAAKTLHFSSVCKKRTFGPF